MSIFGEVMKSNKSIKSKHFKEKKKIEIDIAKIIQSFFSLSFFLSLCIIFFVFKGYQLFSYLTYSVNAEKVIFAIDDTRRLCLINAENHLKFSHYQESAQTEFKKFIATRSLVFGKLVFDKNFNDQDESFFKYLSKQVTQNCDELGKTSYKISQEQLESIEDGMIKHLRFL